MTPENRPLYLNNFQKIVDAVNDFNEERGWHPLSGDIAKSVIIEAAELLEQFQWNETKLNRSEDPQKDHEKISEEAADVLIYLISLCQNEGIDLEKAVYEKLKKNEIKYPAEKFQGHHNNEFYMSQKQKYREERSK